VGNLPPGTHILDLKDHFSRDATEQIESVFLISKSNCAFVNYKMEASCAAAMLRFHDSRFQGVRLVCRLRRGSTPSSANPLSGQVDSQGQESKQSSNASGDPAASLPVENERETADLGAEKTKEKYFIVKSLTIEDLELSVRNGTWATQAHNEVALRKAYQVCHDFGTVGYALTVFSLQKMYTLSFRPTNRESTSDMLEWHPISITKVFHHPNILKDSKYNNLYPRSNL
jgi:YT521-B-like domain/RNA recognition motif. (a.k.a. RRM, RBD, or RNP domain)